VVGGGGRSAESQKQSAWQRHFKKASRGQGG
jgi:hypothetical protein